jgi:alpha-galactosidase
MKTGAKTSLIAAAFLFSARLLGAADAPTNAATISATPTAPPEILTPKPALTPRINGPKIFGVRPGSPFLYSIPATGDRPMKFSADNLPRGLKLDSKTGRIAGVLKRAGEYTVTLHAKNSLGMAEKPFRIVVGEDIELTPALGWNSYNCYGTSIDEDKELRAAHAMVSSGLAQHGWTYVNMDDGWSARQRGGPFHALQPDPRRYTDIKAMVDEIHGLGLKAGLYSTPWEITYGGHLGGTSEFPDGAWPTNADFRAAKNARKPPYTIGKYSFATNDADQFAAWGFDYLKLDWGPVEAQETKEMYQALRATHRDVVLSLSNNHVKNLFKGIGEVSKWAESWRTTTDINDNWKRVALDIGFAQDAWAPFVRPGHFNDADMLVVGQVGWFGPLRPTKLTPDEQYTHISLWCLLSAPLLLGCDLEKLNDFTLSLLSNDEVLEVDQDALCKQAVQVGGQGDVKVYAKPMDDGSLAVGLFNLDATNATVTANWSDLKIAGKQRVRDLWRQKDLGVFSGKFKATVASHGVVLVRIFPSPQ